MLDARRGQGDPVEVDHIEIGAQAAGDPAAVRHAEEIGGVAGQHPDRLLEGELLAALPVADPVFEHVGRIARVADDGYVRAPVAPADEGPRPVQHLVDRAEMAVRVVAHEDVQEAGPPGCSAASHRAS